MSQNTSQSLLCVPTETYICKVFLVYFHEPFLYFIPLCDAIWVVVSLADLRMQRVKGELRWKESLLEQVRGLARSEPHRPCLSRQGRVQPCLWRAVYSPSGGHTTHNFTRTPPFHQVTSHWFEYTCNCSAWVNSFQRIHVLTAFVWLAHAIAQSWSQVLLLVINSWSTTLSSKWLSGPQFSK